MTKYYSAFTILSNCIQWIIERDWLSHHISARPQDSSQEASMSSQATKVFDEPYHN